MALHVMGIRFPLALQHQALREQRLEAYRMVGKESMTVVLLEVSLTPIPFVSKDLWCLNADIALTFDDGPYLYTSDLLDKLKAYNAKATFFISMA
jgi:peptidoglycan/xylan/chitin deacetylase (PgdA/CDA1 family)